MNRRIFVVLICTLRFILLIIKRIDILFKTIYLNNIISNIGDLKILQNSSSIYTNKINVAIIATHVAILQRLCNNIKIHLTLKNTNINSENFQPHAYGSIRYAGKLLNNPKAGDSIWLGVEWDLTSK